MALSAALSTNVNAVDFTSGGSLLVTVTITTSGTYATHGVTLDLSQLGITSEYAPNPTECYETPAAGSSASGYTYLFIPGTTQANGVVQSFLGGVEQTDATSWPATTLTAVFQFSSL